MNHQTNPVFQYLGLMKHQFNGGYKIGNFLYNKLLCIYIISLIIV